MLTALDADVIKTYVELGMGVGIVAKMAYDAAQGHRIRNARRERICSRASTTRLALRKGVFLRGYVYEFIALVRAAVHAHRRRRGAGRQRAGG